MSRPERVCACGGGCPLFVADSQKNATRRGSCEPAPTVKFGHSMNEVVWVVDRRTNSKDGKGGMYPTVGVPIDRPAPTFTGKSGEQWIIRPPDGVEPCDDASQGAPEVPCDDESEHGRPEWARERPATTVVGSFRPDIIAAPGYRTDISRQDAPDSVKVTIQEAAVLQSFPADYPWHGSRSKQFEQIGNAVPPRLALHVLAAVTGLPMPVDGAS